MKLFQRSENPPGPILPPRRGTGLLHVQTVFLAFIAAVALVTFIASEKDAHAGGSLMVQIMPEGDAPPPGEIAAALSLLKSTPGIASASLMTEEENLALLQPWLSRDSGFDSLPFPALIDVKLASGAKPDVTALTTRLLARAPHAVIAGSDDRSAFGVNRAVWIGIVVLVGTFFVFLLSYASATRAQVWVQRDALDLLRLLGATNRRVAQIFARRPTTSALIAALLGTALGIGSMLIASGPQRFGIKAAPLVSALDMRDLAWLALVPVATAIMAWLIARFLVNSTLRSY